jgi:hypothetical protein
MSQADLHFPKCYELDELYFTFILRLIRYEIITNKDRYSDESGLRWLVMDMEQHRWYLDAKKTIDFTHYCGGIRSHTVFVECLNRVRALLLSFGPEVPAEWRVKLKVETKEEVFSLNSIHELVRSLKPDVSEEWRLHLKPEVQDKAMSLSGIREYLKHFELDVPEAWLREQRAKAKDDMIYPHPFPTKPILYWLDCLRQAVAEYRPNIGITIFPSPLSNY